MRGFDVTERGVNRDRWINGAVCAYWANSTVFAEYGDLAYRVICLRSQQFHSNTRGVGRVCGSGVMVGGGDVKIVILEWFSGSTEIQDV